MKVFISYARQDSETAEKIYDDLKQQNNDVWLDVKELLPGQRWKAEISKAIKASSHFLALFSSNSVSARGFFKANSKKPSKFLTNCRNMRFFSFRFVWMNVSRVMKKFRIFTGLTCFPAMKPAFVRFSGYSCLMTHQNLKLLSVTSRKKKNRHQRQTKRKLRHRNISSGKISSPLHLLKKPSESLN